ncbi:MAG: GNAT family N-acetyltransferase [Gemmatimonadetes bacterium]|nr:GNAT family N-acetyltransferase [Gemmatimonadota bacterium]
MTRSDIDIREAHDADLDHLQAVRAAAFAPVFASFRSILGDEIADVAQARADEEQADYLASLLAADSKWDVYVAQVSDAIVGFVSVRLDEDARLGEIGLNAVLPRSSGRGIGTAMYEFVLERMKEVGIRVATVSTGGDASHAPARRAYEKVGFTVGIPSVWLCCHLDTA